MTFFRLRGGGRGADGIKQGTTDLSPTMHRDSVTQDIANRLINDVASAAEIAPFAMSSYAVDALIAVGIPASRAFTSSHRHPVHKAIENWILLRVIPDLITYECTAAWIKMVKFEKLVKRQSLLQRVINPIRTPRDFSRYRSTPILNFDTCSLFLHDVAHYLTPAELVGLFECNSNLKEIVATVIYPCEVLSREKSFHPLIYDLHYDSEGFTYFLEGDATDAYYQPFMDWIITTNKLLTSFGVVTIERIEGFYGHHVIVFRRGNYTTNPYYLAPLPDCVLLPEVGVLQKTIRSRLVPKEIYEKAVHHARNLKSLRPQDAIAKVRSYQHDVQHAWVESYSWEYMTRFVVAAAEMTGESPDVSTELNWPDWCRRLYSYWRNRTWWSFPVCFSFEWLAGVVVWKLPRFRFYGYTGRFFDHLLTGQRYLERGYIFPTFRSRYNFQERLLNLVGKYSRKYVATTALLGLTLCGGLIYLASPPLWNPSAREKRRLELLYPDKYVRQIFLNTIRVNKPKLLEEFSQTAAILGTDSEFSEYEPMPQAFPDEIISDGTDLTDVGASISQVGQLPEAIREKKFNPIVKLPSIEVYESSAVDLKSDLSLEVDKLTPVVQCDGGFIKRKRPNKKNRRGKKKKNKTLVSEIDESSFDDTIDVIVNKNDDLPIDQGRIPAEGVGNGVQLHKRYDISDQQVFGNYEDFADLGECFDGDFQKVPLCLLNALQIVSSLRFEDLIEPFKQVPKVNIVNQVLEKEGLSDWHAALLAYYHKWDLFIHHEWGRLRVGIEGGKPLIIWHTTFNGFGHFTHVKPHYPERNLSEAPKPGGFHGASEGTQFFQIKLLSWTGEDQQAIPFLGFRSYVMNPERAKPLARDMASGKTGVVFGPAEKYNMDKDMQVRWKSLVDGQIEKNKAQRPKVHVSAIYGYPGCGKTWPVCQVLKLIGDALDFRVAVPTVKLREEWQKMLNLSEVNRWRINTYESTMRKHTEVLIIDEISMMPAGYVDFLIAISPKLRCILILGDVTQIDRHESHPDATCGLLLPEAHYWRHFSPFYLGYTRRLDKTVAKLLGVKTYSDEVGFVSNRLSRSSGPLITALGGDAKALNELGQGAVTFPSCQGSTYRSPVQILLDKAAIEKCSIGAVHTAVTRSTKGIYLIGQITGERAKAAYANPFWNALLTKKPVDWRTIFSSELIGMVILDEPFKHGMRKLYGGEILVEHNFPLEYLPPSRRVGHTGLVENQLVDFDFGEHELIDELPRVTWGQMDAKNLFNQIYILKPVDSKERLVRSGMEPSKQFNDGEPEGKNEDGDYPEQIAAKHYNKDDTLLSLSIPKRIRFATSAANKQEIISKELVGQELFQSYCRLMNLDSSKPFVFDDILYHECVNYNEWHSLTNKTRAVILANESKSDPDWVWTFIRLFMKQQRKINDSTLNGVWKAGQTISNMNDQWLLFLGPTIRYMSALEKRYCPKRIYLHGGRSNIDLDNFCKANLEPGLKYANDYTSFDQSQNAEVLNSELLYMWHAGIPDEIIEMYKNCKSEMKCFLGDLKIMRFSGEPATYAFNCRCNLAVMNLQFPLDQVDLPVMVSGDDGGIGGVLPERTCWKSFSTQLSLVAKPVVSSRLVFVGYICSHLGALRDPVPMLARFYLASDAQKLHLIVQSYATELSTGYLMAEGVIDLLTDFELDCFFCLIRAFHLNNASSKLKFRKDALLGFVNLADKALGRLKNGSKLSPELRRDLVSYYWRLESQERDSVYKLVLSLTNCNLLEYGRGSIGLNR